MSMYDRITVIFCVVLCGNNFKNDDAAIKELLPEQVKYSSTV